MAVRKKNIDESLKLLDGTSTRDFIFYARILVNKSMIYHSSDISPESCKHVVLKYLSGHTSEERTNQIIWLNGVRSEQLLPENYFEWLRIDERACCWAWGYLIDSSTRSDGSTNFPPEEDFQNSLIKTPVNTSDRLESIIYFFDTSSGSIKNKKMLIEKMKESWISINNTPLSRTNSHPARFVKSSDSAQCEWAWSYLKEKGMAIQDFKPINPSEKHLATIASVDLANIHIDTKRIFLMGMKKAWDQKTYRKKQEGKKPLNTYINEDTKGKLVWLANQREQNINKTLEWLINKEYEKHT